LREEILPLHQSRIPVGIILDSLPDYIETWVRSGKVANINVATTYVFHHREFPSSFDAKKLFLLCAEKSAIRIRFRAKIYHEFEDIVRDQSKYTRFFEYVKTKVDSAQFAEGLFYHQWQDYGAPVVRLYLMVKQQFEHYWMARPCIADYKEKLGLWRLELGVRGMEVYPEPTHGMVSTSLRYESQ
jgi:hypothetical protein